MVFAHVVIIGEHSLEYLSLALLLGASLGLFSLTVIRKLQSLDHEIVDDFGWLQLSSLTFT